MVDSRTRSTTTTDTQQAFQRTHTLLPAVDELPSVHALHSHDKLVVAPELVGVLELDLGQGRTPPGLVHDLLDHALDVPVALRVVELTELHGALPQAGVGGKDTTLTLPLSTNNLTHGVALPGEVGVWCPRRPSREAMCLKGSTASPHKMWH